jgi:tetratricopeptide (TPR) repeat protein
MKQLILGILVLVGFASGCTHTVERDSRSPFTHTPGDRTTDDSFEVLQATGDAAFDQRLYKKALECYQKAERQKVFAPLKVRIGNCLFELERLDKAMEKYQQALDLDEDLLGVRVNLARCHIEKENYQKALELLEEAENLKPGRTEVLELYSEVVRLMQESQEKCQQEE